MTTPDPSQDENIKTSDRDGSYLASFEARGHKVKRITLGIVFALLALLMVRAFFGGPVRVANYTNGLPIRPPDMVTTTVGTGTVSSCEHVGWIRTALVGDSWDCWVDVRWNAGEPRTGQYYSSNWELDENDTGKTFSVVKVSAGSRFSSPRMSVAKNEQHPYDGWTIPILIVSAVLFLFFAAHAILRLGSFRLILSVSPKERDKIRARLKQEGKIPDWYEPGMEPPPDN